MAKIYIKNAEQIEGIRKASKLAAEVLGTLHHLSNRGSVQGNWTNCVMNSSQIMALFRPL